MAAVSQNSDAAMAMLRNIIWWLNVVFSLSHASALSLNEADFEEFKREVKQHLNTLEERVEKLEELAKIGTLRSCAEYAQYGLKSSGLYLVDPDGPLLGHPPFQVFCNFDAGGCVGVGGVL